MSQCRFKGAEMGNFMVTSGQGMWFIFWLLCRDRDKTRDKADFVLCIGAGCDPERCGGHASVLNGKMI